MVFFFWRSKALNIKKAFRHAADRRDESLKYLRDGVDMLTDIQDVEIHNGALDRRDPNKKMEFADFVGPDRRKVED